MWIIGALVKFIGHIVLIRTMGYCFMDQPAGSSCHHICFCILSAGPVVMASLVITKWVDVTLWPLFTSSNLVLSDRQPVLPLWKGPNSFIYLLPSSSPATAAASDLIAVPAAGANILASSSGADKQRKGWKRLRSVQESLCWERA